MAKKNGALMSPHTPADLNGPDKLYPPLCNLWWTARRLSSANDDAAPLQLVAQRGQAGARKWRTRTVITLTSPIVHYRPGIWQSGRHV
jgi:hypothetical protein